MPPRRRHRPAADYPIDRKAARRGMIARLQMLRRGREGAILLLSIPIHAYRYLLSPMLPPSCRFAPSCSAYALEALSVHGPIKGLWLALRRVSRCHPIAVLG